MGAGMGMGPGQAGRAGIDGGRIGLGPAIAAAVLMSLFDD